jgi:hypothetical protein
MFAAGPFFTKAAESAEKTIKYTDVPNEISKVGKPDGA